MNGTDVITVGALIIVLIIFGGVIWASIRNKNNDHRYGIGK